MRQLLRTLFIFTTFGLIFTSKGVTFEFLDYKTQLCLWDQPEAVIEPEEEEDFYLKLEKKKKRDMHYIRTCPSLF